MSSSSRLPSAKSDAGEPLLRQPAGALQRLRNGMPITEPTRIVTAHPDDETICMGGRLADFRDAILIQVTDGAPAAAGAPSADPDAYRRTRRVELERALGALGVTAPRIELGVSDQAAAFRLAELSRSLQRLLRGAAIVLTHPYEAGHPDHDAAAFAVQSACALLRRAGELAPVRLEFACYHQLVGARRTGMFRPAVGRSSVRAELGPDKLARKRSALACFRSQADVIDWFSPRFECYRAAPDYDFTAPPGPALYEQWGWAMTGARWRALAAATLDELGLAARP